MIYSKVKQITFILILSLGLLSCNKDQEEGEVTINLKPSGASVIKVKNGSSCHDLRDYELTKATANPLLQHSLDGYIFYFSSLRLDYSAYKTFSVLSRAIYIDFNDARIGGKMRCDISQEADAFFDSTVFGNSTVPAVNGVNGVYQSTSACKIICDKQFTVPEDLKQRDFSVAGIFKVQFTVQKTGTDDPPVNIYSQDSVTVNVNVD